MAHISEINVFLRHQADFDSTPTLPYVKAKLFLFWERSGLGVLQAFYMYMVLSTTRKILQSTLHCDIHVSVNDAQLVWLHQP